jgi:hypothetical protein
VASLTRPRWSRLASGATLVLAVAAAAAGCTSAPAATTSTSAGPSAPALTTAQAREIFDAYLAANATAARTNDSALALSVVTGVQHGILAAMLKGVMSVCTTTPAGDAAFSGEGCFYGHPDYDQYAYGPPDIYLPEPAGYPRFFLADVTRTLKTLKGTTPGQAAATWSGPAGVTVPENGPALMVFEQASASTGWQLATVSQFPAGMALPRLATDKSGYVPQVPLSAANLFALPAATGPLQAAVVDDGTASAAAKAVATGPLTTGLYQGVSEHGLTAPAGDLYRWYLEGAPYPTFALRTASGGALVLYAMYLNSTVGVPGVINRTSLIKPGLPIEVPADFQMLVPQGKSAPRKSLETQQLLSFAAIDPPAGGAGVAVIAIGGGPNYATAS